MDIWQKGSTFPQPCLDELKVKLANAMASAGSSKSVDGADVKKEQKSSSLASGESKGSGKSFSQNFFFFFYCFVRHQWRPCMCSSSGNGVWSNASVLEKKKGIQQARQIRHAAAFTVTCKRIHHRHLCSKKTTKTCSFFCR